MQVMKHVHYEDENTRYVDIGPVNKVINMLCCWFEDPDSVAFKKCVHGGGQGRAGSGLVRLVLQELTALAALQAG